MGRAQRRMRRMKRRLLDELITERYGGPKRLEERDYTEEEQSRHRRELGKELRKKSDDSDS